MKILFATTNLAKIKKYKDKLSKEGIELITINDLDFKLDIDENGKDAIENAYIKAKALFLTSLFIIKLTYNPFNNFIFYSHIFFFFKLHIRNTISTI